MRTYDYFNKRRVTLQDMNDMQSWIGQDIRNYIGAHLEKGIIRPAGTLMLGDNNYGFAKKPQQVVFDLSDPFGNSFSLPIDLNGSSAIYGVDASCNLFHISVNETYKPTPTNFQNGGNIGIPLSNGDGDYYVWIGYRTIDDATYSKQDKSGVTHYPRQYESYAITVVFNNPAQPPIDVIFLGKITKVATLLSIDPTGRPFAGIKQENVNITINTALKPSAYTIASTAFLSDHINAIGAGIVTEDNPHGIIAKDADAISQSEFGNDYNIITNGMIYVGSSLTSSYSELDLKVPITKFNGGTSPGNDHYIKVDRNSNYQIIFNGRIFNLSNAEPFDVGISAVRLDFSGNGAGGGIDANEGWYRIYFEQDNIDDDFVTLKKQFVGTSLTNSEVISNEQAQSNKCVVGYVWWRNSSALSELRTHDKYENASSPYIQPIMMAGAINPANIFKNKDLNYQKNNKNLLHQSNFINNMWIQTSITPPLWNYNYDISGKGSTIIGLSSVTGNMGKKIRATNIQNNTFFDIKIPIASCFGWTLNYGVSTSTTASNVAVEIQPMPSSANETQYPALSLGGTDYVMHSTFTATSVGATIQIRIKFLGAWSGADWVDFDFYGLYGGVGYDTEHPYRGCTAPQYLSDISHTNVLDSDEKRSSVSNQSLANIIKLSGIFSGVEGHNQPSKAYSASDFTSKNIISATSGILDNIEIKFIYSYASWEGAVAEHRGSISYSATDYELVYVSLTPLSEPPNNSFSGTNTIIIRDVFVSGAVGIISYSTIGQTLNNGVHYPVMIMLMLKKR